MPLNAWFKLEKTHAGLPCGDMTGDYLAVIAGAAGPDGKALGEAVDVWELSKKLPGAKLQAALDSSGKKGPVLKKLYSRLHYELNYPLTEKQAKKIKVKPHAEEAVTPAGAGAKA